MDTVETESYATSSNRTTLVSLVHTSGNGYVAEYGWIKAFAFDIPTALRRLAQEIEKCGLMSTKERR